MMDNLLKETADLEKASAANLDLASDGKSTHPSAKVDDKTQAAREGSRSAENEADVRKDVPDNVEESGSKNAPGGSKKPSDSMGTVSMDADSGLQGNVDTPKKDHSQSMSDSGPGDGSETFSGDWDKASAADLLGEANGILADIAKIAAVEIEIEKRTKRRKARKPPPSPLPRRWPPTRNSSRCTSRPPRRSRMLKKQAMPQRACWRSISSAVRSLPPTIRTVRS